MPTFTRKTGPGSENAIVGVADKGIGVYGTSNTSAGTGGASDSGIGVHGVSKTGPGVRGDADNGVGVFGGSKTSSGVGGMTDSGIGVHGAAKTGVGVRGDSETWQGVYGHSTGNAGVVGESAQFEGVRGISLAENHGGVVGVNDNQTDTAGPGVYGESKFGEGVRGISHSEEHSGVVGINDWRPKGFPLGPRGNVNGGWFESSRGEGVRGTANNQLYGGVVGVNTAKGIAVYGTSDDGVGIHGKGGRLAGFFEGDVEVTGHIRFGNADCAEDFNIGSDVTVEPGTVMVLGEEGALFPSQRSYDKCVAGVVSGAGDYKPGIVLDKQPSQGNRKPIALLGKVFCKVDAQFGPIEVGDR